MNLQFYKGNAKVTGTACSFQTKGTSLFVNFIKQHSWNEAKKLGSCNESHVEGGICPIKPAASSSPHDVNCPESSNTALSWFEILPTPQMLQTGLGNFDSDIVEFLAVGLVDGVFDDTSAVGCDVSL